MSENNQEWLKLINISKELTEYFEDIVFIGGVATYYHSIKNKLSESMLEQSHDSDFYISNSDFIDLKDLYDVTSNKRLNKHQFIKQDLEFDIYLENTHNLIIPYENLINKAVLYEGLRFASLEHLLPLKLKAYEDRKNSAKGDKDKRDIIKIIILLNENKENIDSKEINLFIDESMIELCSDIQKNNQPFLLLCNNNAYNAKELKNKYVNGLNYIKNSINNKLDTKKWKLN